VGLTVGGGRALGNYSLHITVWLFLTVSATTHAYLARHQSSIRMTSRNLNRLDNHCIISCQTTAASKHLNAWETKCREIFQHETESWRGAAYKIRICRMCSAYRRQYTVTRSTAQSRNPIRRLSTSLVTRANFQTSVTRNDWLQLQH